MSKSILVIEDNEFIRQNTAEILELSGYVVLQASNGKFGIDLTLQNKPDLILCDIMMPELDGYGVLYLLRKNPETNFIPFIFLTAKGEHLDFRKGMELGADDYLVKPFNEQELLNAIESRLLRSKSQQTFYSKTIHSLENLSQTAGSGTDELKAMINNHKIRHVKKNLVLYYDGDRPTGIYIVIEGSIKTIKIADDGRELMIGLYHKNDYLGISSLLLDEPFNETAEAIEDAIVCMLPKEALVPLINLYPDVGQQFIKILSNHVHEKEDQLLALAYHSVRKRLAQIFIRLSKQNKGSTAEIKVSREELAAMAGIATETVSRTLSDFKDEGLIDKKGYKIIVLDLDGLISMKN